MTLSKKTAYLARLHPKHLVRIIKYIYMFGYFIISFFTYKKIRPSVYISPFCKIYNKSNCSFGERSDVKSWSTISGTNFTCGERVSIGHGCHIIGDVRIGNDVRFAANCSVVSDYYGIRKGESIFDQQGTTKGPVVIGSDVWIGTNSVILSGVQISDGAVIGAGSVVTKSIPENAVAVGNPAKVIRYREEY